MLIYSYQHLTWNLEKLVKFCKNAPPQFLFFFITTLVDTTVFENKKCFIYEEWRNYGNSIFT